MIYFLTFLGGAMSGIVLMCLMVAGRDDEEE